MSQPAFPVVCDNCLESAADWYAIGHAWICAGCWDPFGDFAHLDERRSANGVDRAGRDMMGRTTETAQRQCVNTVAPLGLAINELALEGVRMTDNHLTRTPAQPSPEGSNPDPVKLGDLLPGVLAEMRRLQREAGR